MQRLRIKLAAIKASLHCSQMHVSEEHDAYTQSPTVLLRQLTVHAGGVVGDMAVLVVVATTVVVLMHGDMPA